MIQPEDQLEVAQMYFEKYKPIFEEMFDVDLSEYSVKGRRGYIRDALKDEGTEPVFLVKRQEIEERLEGIAGKHWRKMRSIYVVSSKAKEESKIAKTIAHELAHAVHYGLMKDERAKSVTDKSLRKLIMEGFAELIEVDAFANHYSGAEAQELGAKDRRDHVKHATTFYKTIQFPEGTFDPEEMRRRYREDFAGQVLKEALMELKVQDYLDGDDDIEYNLGYVFFRRAQQLGISPEDILREPPESLMDFAAPDRYAEGIKP